MNHNETTLQFDRVEPQRFRGKIGVGHIPTLIVALGLWWWIISVLPFGQ